MRSSGGPRFEVRIDERALADDLSLATPAGRAAIEPAVEKFRADGIEASWLSPCEDEGYDGSRLGGCVKCRIPHPRGRWGAVFVGVMEGSKPVLVLLGVAERHPQSEWRPSVYVIAGRRLNSG